MAVKAAAKEAAKAAAKAAANAAANMAAKVETRPDGLGFLASTFMVVPMSDAIASGSCVLMLILCARLPL